ncbi:MAG: winged helix-turn-helix domain-containing protein [Bacteroidetes bacterium]|nr:winged helix-turn-helix domain-containing protein [Bacteroidota bacterium]
MLRLEGVAKRLTPLETKVLLVLSSKINKVLAREEIATIGWGSCDYYKDRSMDVYIYRLRKYLAADPMLSIMGFSLVAK